MPARAAACAPGDLALGLHHAGEPGRRDAERQADRRAEHVPAGADLRHVAQDRRVELDVGERLPGPGDATARPRPSRRCSRTPPAGCGAWRSGAGPRSSAPCPACACVASSSGFLNCISGARSCRLGNRRFICRFIEILPAGARCGTKRCGGQRGRHGATQVVEIAAQQAVRAGLDEHVADRGRLDRARDHRPADPVGDQLAEQARSGRRRRRCAPSRPGRPTARRPARRRGRTPRPGSRRWRAPAPAGLGGAGSPRSAYQPRDAARACRRASRKRGSSASNTAAGGGQCGGLRQQLRQVDRARRRAPSCRTDSLSSHRPITLRRNRIRPSTPPSLVKLAARAASVSTGRVQLDADQRPGAAGDVGRDPAVIGTATTAEAVSCDADRGDRAAPVAARPGRRGRAAAAPSGVPGLDQRGEQRRRAARAVDSARRPSARRRRAARSSRRWSARSTSRRSASSRSGRGPAARVSATSSSPSAGRGELVQRVERQELQPVARVELARGATRGVHGLDAARAPRSSR